MLLSTLGVSWYPPDAFRRGLAAGMRVSTLLAVPLPG
jgi:hypothetical protein